MLADIRDYFMYLCLDAYKDPKLARSLVTVFNRLEAWLDKKLKHRPIWQQETETIRWYIGWLFALEQLLSLRHEIAKLPSEAINREDFKRSWAKTAEKLGL
jgi:hypothetical protein